MMQVNEQPQEVSITACCVDLKVAFVVLQLLARPPLEQLLTDFRSSQSFLLASAAPVRVTDVIQMFSTELNGHLEPSAAHNGSKNVSLHKAL